jgi:DNA-3-methyladenine glycosylase I
MPHEKPRCGWAGSDPLYQAYHDQEWGRAVHDDRVLFEFLILEGFQAGLSWITILRKRESFRKAFAGFNWKKVARFTQHDIDRLLADAGIVRNRLKINAAITNANCFEKVISEFGSFDRYIWQFTNNKTIKLTPRSTDFRKLPCRSEISDTMSKDLTRRGFKFVGSVICYSFMQAVGMIDDHVKGCFRADK